MGLGKVEDGLKIDKRIQNYIKGRQDYIIGFYYSLSSLKSYTSKANYVYAVCDYVDYVESIGFNVKDPMNLTLDSVNAYFNYISHVKRNGKIVDSSISYRNNRWSALNKFFRYLKGSKKITDNPMEYVDRVSGEDNVRRVYLNRDEIKKLFMEFEDNDEWTTDRDKAIITILLQTGIRVTALTEIDMEDIIANGDGGLIIRVLDKGNKYFEKEIPTQAAEIINRWIGVRNSRPFNNKCGALFVNSSGKRITSEGVRYIVKKYAPEGITPHKFRSTFGSYLYLNTHDIYFVQTQMGHSSPKTTERYAIQDGGGEKKAADIMGGVIFG